MLEALPPSSTRSPATRRRACRARRAGKAFCAGHDLKEMRAEPSLAYYQTPVRAMQRR
jgi:enoyl-CoA hydratase/carnithine racemase